MRKFSAVSYVAALIPGLSLSAVALAASPVPANLGAGLRPLMQEYVADPQAARSLIDKLQSINTDDKGRVLVDIYPAKGRQAEALREPLTRAGAEVRTVYTRYRNGVISAFVPLSAVNAIARLDGVSSVILVHKPVTNVGATTAQGTSVLRSDLVNAAGITGEGITVGVMSDSYNTSRNAAFDAADDVASGDLPDLTNSSRNSPGVKFLIEGPRGGTDEGRGMAQIVYDVAPGVELCFATAYDSQAEFASNILELRTNPACNADVIVDDIIYYAEPMFSDGIIAQAVDEVVTSDALAGKKVAYFSSAGNRGEAYTSKFRKVKYKDAVALPELSVDLSQIPADVNVKGGFHNFDYNGGVDIAQSFTCSSTCTIVFQWDDPFDLPGGGVTTDFNFLVFDASGNYVSSLSLTDDNFATNQPYEQSLNTLASGQVYQIVLARSGEGSKEAGYVKYVSFGGSMTVEYNDKKGYDASTYGHNSAAHGNGVGAYIYDDVPVSTPPLDAYTPSLESYSSAGPVLMMFDAAGNRLPEIEVRDKPDLSAPDGVNTTFFPSGSLASTDYEGDGFPNFFGTSAAAPHAAGVAALLLQKAGGPLSLSPAAIRSVMQSTAPERDIDATYADAVLRADGSGELLAKLEAVGASATDPNFFRLSLFSTGLEMTTVTIDVSALGLQFDPNAETGFPITVGDSSGASITSDLPTTPTSVLTLEFSGLTSGNYIHFGVDRDVAAIAGYGNSADLLGGASITGTINGETGTIPMLNKYGSGYSYDDGYGLIDAKAAVDATP